MKATTDELAPTFHNVSHGRPLTDQVERQKITSGLWTSIAAADAAADQVSASRNVEPQSRANDDDICRKIVQGLQFKDIMARETQIQDPFPETFKWLFAEKTRVYGESTPAEMGDFKAWLESQVNDTPFWITGKPASGKSTLMKYICTHADLATNLRRWSGTLNLLTCRVYFWNPGVMAQKSQTGLLRTMLHQLLAQRPHLCRYVATKRYIYFQLAGTDESEPAEWTVEELRECITQVVSKLEGTDSVFILVDGLDEFEGDLSELISFLKRLHRHQNVKLCVSSRPWNIFRDEFHTYPSLRMELLTRPDIERYVRTRMRGCRALQELRAIDRESVEDLERQIIEKAEGIFLWVVLVVEKIVTVAQDNNDLRTIWAEFEALPPGLEELYSSMRRRLDSAHLEAASRMYQLLFRWTKLQTSVLKTKYFWMAINCHDTVELPQVPSERAIPGILPALERRLAGQTGGMLQVVRERSLSDLENTHVNFLHRTVFDWLQSVRPMIINDGPADYDPSVVLASVIVSEDNYIYSLPAYSQNYTPRMTVFEIGQTCNQSKASRLALLRVIDQIQRPEPKMVLGNTNATVPTAAIFTYCAPYLEAKRETSMAATAPPRPFWKSHLPKSLMRTSDKDAIGLMSDMALHLKRTPKTAYELNIKLQTFDILVKVSFAPVREVAAQVKKKQKTQEWPVAYWKALSSILRGEGYVELTDEIVARYDHDPAFGST